MKFIPTILSAAIASMLLISGFPAQSAAQGIVVPQTIASDEVDELKLKGKLTKISPRQIVLVKKDDTRQKIRLSADTVYRKNKKPAEFEDLQKGDRVIVKATPISGEIPEAIQVNIVPDTAGRQ